MTAPAPLTRVEALMLRHGAGGTWMVRCLLTDHQRGVEQAKAGQLGGSFCAPGYDGWWLQTTAKGIGIASDVRRCLRGDFTHFLPWRRIREHASTLTVEVLDELREAGAGVVQLAQKRWAHPHRAYGPLHWLGGEGPLTLAQDNADEGHRQWWEREPEFSAWERQWAARERRAIERAVPLPPLVAPPAGEQTDLLDLLAVTA